MITQFRIRNYKALRDVTLDLSPIHLLIGPNDTGKTSILDAVAALCRSVDHPLAAAFTGNWKGHELVWHGDANLPISLEVSIEHAERIFQYLLSCRFSPRDRGAYIEKETYFSAGEAETLELTSKNHKSSEIFRITQQPGDVTVDKLNTSRLVLDALTGVHYYRWNPKFLSLPVAPDSKRRFRMEPDGFGLALCLDDILGFDRERFDNLENRFREIFPQIKSIKLIPEPAFRAPTNDPQQIPVLQSAEGKGIYLEFSDNEQLVPASQVSDGIMLILAYLTVLHLPKPPRVVLVEEPENGIHPKRLQDVLTILRDLVSKQTHSQVILTTHSPYVVDLFEPNEVTLCNKNADGSVSVHRLSESEAVRKQLKIFTLGEIWTSEGDEALTHSNKPKKQAQT